MAMQRIIPSFKDSIFPAAADSLVDIAEVGIDSILDDNLIKDLPIVGTLVGVGSVYLNIRERNLLQQTLAFIEGLNSKALNEEKKQKYKRKLEGNSKKAETELGRVLVILDDFIDKEKTIMLGQIYQYYVNEEISWSEFCDFSEIIRRIFLSDIDWLKRIYIMTNNLEGFLLEPLIYSTDRLSSIGLVYLVNSPGISGTQFRIERKVNLTSIGKKFCEMVM